MDTKFDYIETVDYDGKSRCDIFRVVMIGNFFVVKGAFIMGLLVGSPIQNRDWVVRVKRHDEKADFTKAVTWKWSHGLLSCYSNATQTQARYVYRPFEPIESWNYPSADSLFVK